MLKTLRPSLPCCNPQTPHQSSLSISSLKYPFSCQSDHSPPICSLSLELCPCIGIDSKLFFSLRPLTTVHLLHWLAIFAQTNAERCNDLKYYGSCRTYQNYAIDAASVEKRCKKNRKCIGTILKFGTKVGKCISVQPLEIEIVEFLGSPKSAGKKWDGQLAVSMGCEYR